MKDAGKSKCVAFTERSSPKCVSEEKNLLVGKSDDDDGISSRFRGRSRVDLICEVLIGENVVGSTEFGCTTGKFESAVAVENDQTTFVDVGRNGRAFENDELRGGERVS